MLGLYLFVGFVGAGTEFVVSQPKGFKRLLQVGREELCHVVHELDLRVLRLHLRREQI